MLKHRNRSFQQCQWNWGFWLRLLKTLEFPILHLDVSSHDVHDMITIMHSCQCICVTCSSECWLELSSVYSIVWIKHGTIATAPRLESVFAMNRSSLRLWGTQLNEHIMPDSIDSHYCLKKQMYWRYTNIRYWCRTHYASLLAEHAYTSIQSWVITVMLPAAENWDEVEMFTTQPFGT